MRWRGFFGGVGGLFGLWCQLLMWKGWVRGRGGGVIGDYLSELRDFVWYSHYAGYCRKKI